MAVDPIFQQLINVITTQQQLINSIAQEIQELKGIGGGGGTGNAVIEDYVSDHVYRRNTLVVDPNTETVYRVITNEYTSITVEQDCANGDLKLVGFESQIVTFNGNPTQSQINVLPEDTLVAIYSASDTPYQPDAFE
jgi:hypothetical protein